MEYVKENGHCPHDDCCSSVDPDSETVRFFEAKLDRMFVDYSKVLADSRKLVSGHEGPVISVSAMNGDTAWVPFNPRMTVSELKREVENQLGIKETQQKILYAERGLKVNRNVYYCRYIDLFVLDILDCTDMSVHTRCIGFVKYFM